MHVHTYIIAIYNSKYLYCSLELYSYFIPDSEGYHPPPKHNSVNVNSLHHKCFLFITSFSLLVAYVMEGKKLTKYTCVLSIIAFGYYCMWENFGMGKN